MKKHRKIYFIILLVIAQFSKEESPSKLEKCFEQYFDFVQMTDNGLLLKPKSGEWVSAPLNITKYKIHPSGEEILIKQGYNSYVAKEKVSFTFLTLDSEFGNGFFVFFTQTSSRSRKRIFGAITQPNQSTAEKYIISDGQGIPVHFWNSIKESGLLEIYKAESDTPIYPPPSLTNQVIQEKEPHSKTTPIKKIIPPKTKPQRLEKVKSTPEVSIPKEPVTEQPSQIKKNLTLPISLGGFLILLGGWFFWKKGQ